MAITHHIIIFITLLFTSTSTVTAAATVSKSKPTQTNIPPVISPAAKSFTDAHNKARATVNVPPLVWSQTLQTAVDRLARYQRNQKNCEFANLNPGKYGANQLWAKGLAVVSPSLAVETWVKEKAYYDYKSDTCVANHTCGVYKQVVWRDVCSSYV